MMKLLQEIDQVTGRIRLLGDNTEDEWSRRVLIWWIAMRIIKQYHNDVWVGLYESPYEFVEKDNERERQEREDLPDEDESLDSDEEEEERRPVKRRRLSKKKPRAVYKSFNDPPGLTYASVQKELGEEPHSCKGGKYYHNIKDIFQLLFLSQFERDNGLKGGWKKQSYLHGLKSARDRLESKDYQQVVGRMRRLFSKYCLCIPSMSRDRWLANSAHSKFKSTWIGFDEYGERMDYPHMEDGYGGVYGSTWHKEISIHEDFFWNITCDDATSDEGLRRGREYLKALLNN
jgi:hypothetical protein